MADPSTYRPSSGTIPTGPGVYRFSDAHGQVIYVGKAKNLRNRLNSYFADLAGLHPRTRQMVTTATSVMWTVVSTEVEALQLEYNWIKQFDPRFNVRYRDDKSYPMLAVSVGEELPRLFVYRGPRRKGVRYFGPYSHAWAIRETLDTVLRVFPARTCSGGVLRRHQQLGRPCLLGYIDKCSAPCVGRVSADEHRAIVNDFCDFLSGKTDRLTTALEKAMRQSAAELDFERAARLRDDLGALRRAMEKQSVVLGDGTDADVVAFEVDELEAAVEIFHVRGGRVRGQRGWVVEHNHTLDASTGELPAKALPALVEDFLVQFYGGETDIAKADGTELSSAVPREVLVPALPPDTASMTTWLSAARGSAVSLRIPVRGDKKELAETVRRNAVQALNRHKLQRSGDLTARSAALQELQSQLQLDEAPLRIECVDISHIQGTDVVASLVVFEDGVAKKSDYRTFAIREAAGDGHSDDVASIAEVTRRRFARYLEQEKSVVATESAQIHSVAADAISAQDPAFAPSAAPRRFAYPPNLFVVDGGKPQVNAAAEVLDELGITDIPVIGIAKRLEEVWMPQEDFPLILPRTGHALFLLQRIRDESHRFAIRAHRNARSKRMTASVLDEIPGLGPTRKQALLTEFGSVAKMAEATVEQLTAVKGIGTETARTIARALT